MKVEIVKISASPSDTLLDVYTHNTRPLCRIYEEDFTELLSDKNIELMYSGQTVFTVNSNDLFTKSKTWFGDR